MIEEAIKAGVRTALLDTMVSMPAIVVSFNPGRQTITAELAITRIVNNQSVAFPVLVDIPIIIPSVRGFSITLPIQPGDEVLVVFADRCVDNWIKTGEISSQAEHRVHHISDGFAIIGVNSEPNLIPSYDPDSLVIRNHQGDQKITLEPGKNIKIDTPTDVKVTCNSMTVDASKSVTATTPIFTINGNTVMNGSLLLNGKVSVAGGSTGNSADFSGTITAQGDVIGQGVSLKNHTHPGDSGGTTGKPN